jgi:hypothetical protein
VPELASKATWADRDIDVSGPDAMIAKTVRVLRDKTVRVLRDKTVRVLRDRGAPGHLIRYDLSDEA